MVVHHTIADLTPASPLLEQNFPNAGIFIVNTGKTAIAASVHNQRCQIILVLISSEGC